MTSKELKAELNKRGLTTQVKAAGALMVDQRTVSRWFRDECRIPANMTLLLAAIPVNSKSSGKTKAA
jgi:transcriptional regulator with XRE-family HTH domain